MARGGDGGVGCGGTAAGEEGEEKKERGGEWGSGLGRSEEEEHIWCSPEKSAGKLDCAAKLERLDNEILTRVELINSQKFLRVRFQMIKRSNNFKRMHDSQKGGCMKVLKALQSNFKILSDDLKDFGGVATFKRTFLQDMDLLEKHLTKEILHKD
ncbi:hypothetical protein Tco_0778776 [Tanacetum coccineum]